MFCHFTTTVLNCVGMGICCGDSILKKRCRNEHAMLSPYNSLTSCADHANGNHTHSHRPTQDIVLVYSAVHSLRSHSQLSLDNVLWNIHLSRSSIWAFFVMVQGLGPDMSDKSALGTRAFDCTYRHTEFTDYNIPQPAHRSACIVSQLC